MRDDNRHPLKSLLVTQFFGAFNDNAWKLIVTFLAIRALQSRFTGTEAEFQAFMLRLARILHLAWENQMRDDNRLSPEKLAGDPVFRCLQ